MGLLTRLMERRSRSAGSLKLANAYADPVAKDFFTGNIDEVSGQPVTEKTMLSLPAVFQAMRLISESVGMMPFPLYEVSGGDTQRKKHAKDHCLYRLLHESPHPDWTPMEFWSEMVFNLYLRGDAYAFIQRTKGEKPVYIQPLDAGRMDVGKKNGRRTYTYTETGGRKRKLAVKNVLHVPGFGNGGLIGFAQSTHARRSLGKLIAMDHYSAKVFKTGMSIGSVVETDNKFASEDEKKRFADKLADAYSGTHNAHKVAVFDQGMKFRSVGVTAKETQMLESMVYGLQDVARWFNIPPHFLFDLSQAHFKNVEHFGTQFVRYTLGPVLTRIEQRVKKTLVPEAEWGKLFAEFLVEGLLRADTLTRYQAHQLACGRPWMSVNEVRDIENRDPIDDEDGLAQPLNMGDPGGDPKTTGGNKTEAPKQDGDDDTRGKTCGCGSCETRETREIGDRVSVERRAELRDVTRERRSLRDAFRGQIKRDSDRLMAGVNREVRKLSTKHLAQRDAGDFGKAITNYFEGGKGFRAAVEKILGPIFETYAEAMITAVAREQEADAPDLSDFVQNYIEAFIERKGGSLSGQIRKLIAELEPDKLAEAIEARLTEWEAGREDGERMSQAEKIAGNETVKLGDAVARTAFVALGVTRLAWVANAGACPLCEELDGQIVGTEEVFVEQSGEVDPGDDNIVPLKARSNVNHPPLHGGCECMLAAA